LHPSIWSDLAVVTAERSILPNIAVFADNRASTYHQANTMCNFQAWPYLCLGAYPAKAQVTHQTLTQARNYVQLMLATAMANPIKHHCPETCIPYSHR
jgi:hypothetical protein